MGDLVWYTDGSRMDQGSGIRNSGYGVCNASSDIDISPGLGSHFNILKTITLVVLACECKRQILTWKWQHCPVTKMCRHLIKKSSSDSLFRLKPEHFKQVIDFITGHDYFREHLQIEPLLRRPKLGGQVSRKHVLIDCESLEYKRRRFFGFLEPGDKKYTSIDDEILKVVKVSPTKLKETTMNLWLMYISFVPGYPNITQSTSYVILFDKSKIINFAKLLPKLCIDIYKP